MLFDHLEAWRWKVMTRFFGRKSYWQSNILPSSSILISYNFCPFWHVFVKIIVIMWYYWRIIVVVLVAELWILIGHFPGKYYPVSFVTYEEPLSVLLLLSLKGNSHTGFTIIRPCHATVPYGGAHTTVSYDNCWLVFTMLRNLFLPLCYFTMFYHIVLHCFTFVISSSSQKRSEEGPDIV